MFPQPPHPPSDARAQSDRPKRLHRLEDGQIIGRIRLACEHSPAIWLWNVAVTIPGPPFGSAEAIDDAKARLRLPVLDQALSALIEDLDQRGLLNSTLVVALGEFGRTPKINRNAGRDHWPDCYSAVLAGGGVRAGAVHGSSDKIGAYPASEPVTPGDLAATIFWRFGIDPAAEICDATGRPYRLAEGEPIRALF